MLVPRSLPVVLSGFTEKQLKTSGMVRVQEWTARDRWLRALRFGGGCWGLAVASVFIPVAHFFLVPLFFLAGPFVALVVFSKESVILGGEASCPHCQASLSIAPGAPQFPKRDLCTACQHEVKIELA